MSSRDHTPPTTGGRRLLRWISRTAVGFVALFLVANAVIVLGWAVARLTRHHLPIAAIAGITHLRVVDDRVLRGDAPSPESYQALAEAGVTTVVDLRAERGIVVPEVMLVAAGITRHRLPIRDGQTPTAEQVEAFMEIVREAEGLVYVHCGAGVGRTGSMAAAYVIRSGQASPLAALHANLSVGPPSLEQLAFVMGLARNRAVEQPAVAVSTISRLLDAPRRIWTVLSG